MQTNYCIGRLTKDIELKYTANSKAVCDLNLAVNNGNEDTLFLKIVVFGQTAENCNKYLAKGSLISVSYIIKNHNWEDKNGQKHYDYQFLGNRVVFLDTKQKVENKQETKEEKTVEVKDVFQEFANEVNITDDDLPF